MTRFLFCLIFTTLSVLAFGQQKVSVVFNETTHDFGTIREEQGDVVTEFIFTNTSGQPVSIKKVIVACGCTTPEYSQAPIAPNEKGYIKVTYGAQGRPGVFNKSISIQIGSSSQTITEKITVKGTVTPASLNTEQTFPYNMHGLLFRETITHFGTLLKGATAERDFEVYNSTNMPIALAFNDIPVYLKIAAPSLISPEQKATIKVQYLSEKSSFWGDQTTTIQPMVDGKSGSALTIRATIREDFSQLTDKAIRESPIVQLSLRNINLMAVATGSKRTAQVELKNLGQTPLQIRSINSDTDYLIVTASKQEVKPGKTIVLKITVDASTLEPFQFRKQVQIITNDPISPVSLLTVEWQVVP